MPSEEKVARISEEDKHGRLRKPWFYEENTETREFFPDKGNGDLWVYLL